MEGSRITKHLNGTDKSSLLSPNSRNKKLFLTCRSVGRQRRNKINNATMLPWKVRGNANVGNPTRNCNRNWWDWSRGYENRTGKPKDGWVYVRSPNIYQNWVISTNVITHIVHNRSVIWWSNSAYGGLMRLFRLFVVVKHLSIDLGWKLIWGRLLSLLLS